MTQPRGIRNNNPGNIRKGAPWQGLKRKEDREGLQAKESAFCVFASPEWGIRALAKLLLTYQTRHGLRTVRQMIGRWAPPHENNTNAYVAGVARSVGVAADAMISMQDYRTALAMTKAIIRHENGMMPYSDATLTEGLRRAGIPTPSAPRKAAQADTGKVVGGGIIGTGAVSVAAPLLDQGPQVGEQVRDVAQTVAFMPFASRLFEWPGLLIPLALLAAVAGYAVWRLWKHRRARLEDEKTGAL